LIGLARRIKAQTVASVVCTLQGEDTYLDSLPEPDRQTAWETIAERADDVDAFIAVSRYHADLMCDRGRLPTDRVHVVHNGIRLDGYEKGAPRREADPLILGYLARMCPPKGLETLVDAYIALRTRDRIKNLKLRVAGSQTAADRPFVARLRERLAAKGLEGDAEFLPNVDHAEKLAFLQSLSVLSVPATYGESFGLYVIEALAAGVPVVQPRHAVFPELLEATGGGLLCTPDDPNALAEAIEQLLLDPQRARALGEQGRQAVRAHFSVERMAENVLKVFEQAAVRKSVDGLRV
jgi:glycosyltransferase involved in cell wall biosynthesis